MVVEFSYPVDFSVGRGEILNLFREIDEKE